jgi:hypothetical protein
MKNQLILLSLVSLFILQFLIINTTACSPNWRCTSWSACKSSVDVQKRTCTDSNDCNNNSTKPLERQDCIQCNENWKCAAWVGCTDGKNTRSCIDLNKCGTTQNKPDETIVCNSSSPKNDTTDSTISINNTSEIVDDTITNISQIDDKKNDSYNASGSFLKNNTILIIISASVSVTLILVLLILILIRRKKK